jgi:hypothetical protein
VAICGTRPRAGVEVPPLVQVRSPQGDEGKQRSPARSRASHGPIGPWPLGFYAARNAHFGVSRLSRPTQNKPWHYLHGRPTPIRAQQRLRSELPWRIAKQPPPQGHDWQTDAIPNRGAGGDLKGTGTGTVPRRKREALLSGSGIGRARWPPRPASCLAPRSAAGPFPAGAYHCASQRNRVIQVIARRRWAHPPRNSRAAARLSTTSTSGRSGRQCRSGSTIGRPQAGRVL